MESNIDQLINPQVSESSLVRFGDATDANVPRLNYSVPLPGSFAAKHYIETDFFNNQVPWTPAARTGTNMVRLLTEYLETRRVDPDIPPPLIQDIALLPNLATTRDAGSSVSIPSEPHHEIENRPTIGFINRPVVESVESSSTIDSMRVESSNNDNSEDIFLQYDGSLIPMKELAKAVENNMVPMFYHTFGGTLKMDYAIEAQSEEDANPGFFIVEHYRTSSIFGDYGAGRTVGVFSLMPGEETTLYIRDWRRTEQRIKEASSVFDSFSEEAANEYESDMERENSNSLTHNRSRSIHRKYRAAGEAGYNGRKIKAKASFEGEWSNNLDASSARESISKNVAKVNKKHAAKASSKRDTEVTQEIEKTEEQEFERITERKIKNTNLSRTLNIVTRELNQEFTTFLSLIDVSIAFVNDRNTVEIFQIHEIDDMLDKYVADVSTGGLADPNSPFGGQTPKQFIKDQLLRQINEVYDFRGIRHELLEVVQVNGDEEIARPIAERFELENAYIRVKRNRTINEQNPFYPEGGVPVDGIVLDQSTYTIKTSAVIIDALLGHGIALDNYALGMQQETLREKQLTNQKVELALELINSGNEESLNAYRSIFGSVDQELLERIVES